jgi:hypothetical protein
MSERTRGIVMAVSGLAVLALNVIDAANRGASAFNSLSIAVGAFLLFYGYAVVARTGAPPSSPPPT